MTTEEQIVRYISKPALTLTILIFLIIMPVSAGETTTLLWTFEEQTNFPDTEISPDGNYIIAGGVNSGLYLLNSNGRIIWEKKLPSAVNGVGIAENAEICAAAARGGELYVYNREGKYLWSKQAGGEMYDVSVSKTGEYITAGSDDGYLYLFTGTGDPVWSKQPGGNTYGGDICSVSISENGEYITAGKRLFGLYLYSLSGDMVWYQQISEQVNDVAISPDGKYTGVCGSGGTTIIYQISGDEAERKRNIQPVNSLSISREGRFFATGGEDYYARLFRRDDGEILSYRASGNVRAVSLSPEGTRMAVASNDGRIYFLALPITDPAMPEPPQPCVPAEEPAATLSIYSSPSGAGIIIDSTFSGTTPADGIKVKTGSHNITLIMDGYTEFCSEVSVGDGGKLKLNAELTKNEIPSVDLLSAAILIITALLAGFIGYILGRREKKKFWM
ncbi:PEGA domain-containing protein [Methanoplanus endosymbiosus]|uniref:PEGA domain-containing protein n=1 Tax=Methanoplanus endosymbiosus TaxID=33865 RepID=A0A9E7TIH1_9EURY|nr:PEGA domain-containing protein [Methanoplanus endosymbiosus]UUX92458.1 PEGA domain-containing protein [Methanoplanus endosymbiosus]